MAKQAYELLISKNRRAAGFPEAPISLNSCENGIKAFTNINKTVNKTVAKVNLKNVFITILSLIYFYIIYTKNTIP